MSYTPQTWTNDVSPLNADRMNYMEAGIEAAHNDLVPPGCIQGYAGAAAPTGWLLCDGASYLRGDYTALFTAIGGTGSPWGLPDGTHFNVPDLRGRVPVGLGEHADVNALADNDGSTIANRRPKHNHTMNETAHSHAVSRGDDGSGGTAVAASTFNVDVVDRATETAVTGITVGPQADGTPIDSPAYVVVNYIIKT